MDTDIEACFDSIDHTALMDRVRDRVKDKHVLRLVKAFLKAGVLTEDNSREDTITGTPQGGILSPLLANIALSALDEHLTRPWEPNGEMAGSHLRRWRRATGRPNCRIVRYADDFVVLTDGERDDVEALREDIADVLQPLGLHLSEAKTQVVHMSEGFDFLGFRIQRRRKRGTDKWHVYTFIADRPIRQLKDKIRALTNRTSQQNPRDGLIRLNQIMRGWANYSKHAVCKATLSSLANFTWQRVISWWMALHRWKWKDVRRRLTDYNGRWQRPSADGIELFDLQAVTVTRYRYRGNTIPTPWTRLNGRVRGEPGTRRRVRRVRRAAGRNGPAATPAPRSVPTQQTPPCPCPLPPAGGGRRGSSIDARHLAPSIPGQSVGQLHHRYGAQLREALLRPRQLRESRIPLGQRQDVLLRAVLVDRVGVGSGAARLCPEGPFSSGMPVLSKVVQDGP
ncbi:reverse transcriptase domain-containing protein [Streptomyces goshikiensis]|uniref:reverse transcriptase domain-containing protein n=1 Tax=Streptomyces goshikiensis TaxID=1942 RepID=UPI0036485EAF